MNTAFVTLKERLTHLPVLEFPRFENPFRVGTNASLVAVGTALLQNEADWKMNPFHFAIRTLNSA